MKLLLNKGVVEIFEDGAAENARRDLLKVSTVLLVLGKGSVSLGGELSTVVLPALSENIVNVDECGLILEFFEDLLANSSDVGRIR